jgi:hypothetical protein
MDNVLVAGKLLERRWGSSYQGSGWKEEGYMTEAQEKWSRRSKWPACYSCICRSGNQGLEVSFRAR